LSTPSLPTHLHNGQVDAGLGAEELVENLINGNLELEEKISSHLSGEVLYFKHLVLSFDMHPGK